MTSRNWHILNASEDHIPSDLSKEFTLPVPPTTDIWRPDTKTDVFTAPLLYRVLPIAAFKRISVTVSASWKTQFDQGGLAIVFPDPSSSSGNRIGSKWIKTGIEFYEGKPALSTVTCDRFSDWSLCPLASNDGAKVGTATVEAIREETKLVVNVIEDGVRRPLREVMWAFLEDRDGEAEMWVGVYGAKPTAEEEDAAKGIEVSFEGLVVDVDE
ncbi:hypothetical protein BDV97DRAFT_396264 [Delphinella strobiligena]|nr:hypothetical protein BDV97DRAFT_396264 [Delphinella strobiligena]